jgi:hypothetical protein
MDLQSLTQSVSPVTSQPAGHSFSVAPSQQETRKAHAAPRRVKKGKKIDKFLYDIYGSPPKAPSKPSADASNPTTNDNIFYT